MLYRARTETSPNTTKLIRISFIGASAGEPVISNMVRKFDIDANILYGNVDRVKDTPFGNLTLEMIGEPDLIIQAMEYLHGRGLEIEVLNDV